MSKTIKILAIVLGVLLVLLFMLRKSEKMEPAPTWQGAPAQHEEPAGVSLPPEASVSDEDADVAACEGGSITITDILASQGKTWVLSADSSRYSVIKGSDAEKISAALDEYVTCKAFDSRDPEMCRYASKSSAIRGKPQSQIADGAACVSTLKDFFAMEYMAGKRNEISACEWLMSDTAYDYPKSGIKGISSAEFCPVAATGMENICAGLPALNKKDCRKIFPARESDCGGNYDCLEDFGLYMAVKTDNPAKCNAEMRNYCRMFLSKSKVSCSNLAATAGKVYCSALAKARESSPQGMKEKKEAEKLKEQQK